MWNPDQEPGTEDFGYWKLQDHDLETKLVFNQNSLFSAQGSVKYHKKHVALLQYEINKRKALRGDPIDDDKDRCGVCNRSIEFEHPHTETNSVVEYGSYCPSIPMCDHIRDSIYYNMEYISKDSTFYIRNTTGQLIEKQMPVCRLRGFTAENIVTMLENLKDAGEIKHDTEWVLTEKGLQKYRDKLQVKKLRTELQNADR